MIDKFNSSMYVYESNSTVNNNIPGDTDQEQDEFLLDLVDMF